MNKDYNVKDFVEEYEKQTADSDRSKFLKTKLKTEKYLPYADKVSLSKRIVEGSSYAITNNNGVLNTTDTIAFNSPMRYILFVMTVINKYTNIEVNFKDVMPEFDALNFNNLIEAILAKIGEKEINEFNTVLDMVLDDFVANKYQFKNYISEIIAKLGSYVEKCSPLIDNIANKMENMSEKDVEKLDKLIGKLSIFKK